MTEYRTGFTMIAVLFFMPAITNAEEGTKMTKDRENVLAAVQTMTEALHDGNIDGVMSSYEPGAAVMFEPGKSITDPAVLTRMFQGAFTLNPRFTYSGHEVFVAGDIAVHFAPWTMKGTTPDGQPAEQNGLSVAVLRKQADGNWLMVIDNPHGGALLQ